MDYCNSVLYCMREVYLRPLQSVLNAAARLITGKRKFDRITSTIRDDVHWLPVRQRIVFKLCSMVSSVFVALRSLINGGPIANGVRGVECMVT